MKIKVLSISILLSVILLSACGEKPILVTAPEPAVINTESPTELPVSSEPAAPKPVKYDEVTLTMNKSSLTSFAPIFIAEAEGYFAEYGIKMEYVTFNKVTDAIPLVVTGDLDMYAGSVSAGLLNVLRQEDNIKVVADRGHIAPGDECTYHGLLVRKDLYDSGEITNAADLTGQSIASSTAGASGYILSTYLAEAGLNFDDVILNDIPTAGYIDAFANKSVSVIVVPELHLTRLITAGHAVLLARAEDLIGTIQLSVLAFGKNLIVDHPDVAARFLAAYLKGAQRYQEGKTERNLQIMSEATGESIEMLQAACWLPIRADGSIDFAGIEGFQQWSIDQEQLEAPVTEEQFWDPSFLAAAHILLNP